MCSYVMHMSWSLLFDLVFINEIIYFILFLIYFILIQCAKKFESDSPGLVHFAIGLVDSDGQVKFLGN